MQDDRVHFMADSCEDDLSIINDMLNAVNLEPVDAPICASNAYVLVKADCPGRVSVVDPSQIDVINVDTGMTIKQTEQSSLFKLPRLAYHFS